MKLVTASEMMNADRSMAENYDYPTLLLMEHAAQAVFSEMQKRNLCSKRIAVVCGKGNNGGDGYALARMLFESGADVKIINAFSMMPKGMDAEVNYRICRKTGVRFAEASYIDEADVIVDALFGIGMNNRLNDFCGEIITRINNSDAYVVAIDLPSGAYGDYCVQQNTCVKADLTVTFAAMKNALVFFPSALYAGEVVCRDIGIIDECMDSDKFIIDKPLVSGLLPKRRADGHKGTFGKLVCIAGSPGLSGAAYMCSEAALRSGCGLVKLYVPESISEIMEQKTTEVMTYALPSGGDGLISSASTEITAASLACDAVLFGCGIGRNDEVSDALQALITTTNVPVIIDADGLFALSKNLDILEEKTCPVILTPHLGEMARLSGDTQEELAEKPLLCASRFAVKNGVTLVMKSARTVVASPDGRVFVNIMGNSGLAKGGSGDCLAGIIASLVAQGADALSAAVCGVAVHALAGDISKDKKGSEYSFTPTDIIDNLGFAFSEFEEL